MSCQPTMAALALFLACVASSGTLAQQGPPPPPAPGNSAVVQEKKPPARPEQPKEEVFEDALERLQGRAAWIFLGWIGQDKKWTTARPLFEVLDPRRSPSQLALVPEKGNIIRVTVPTRLVIMDFAITGELKSFKSPGEFDRVTRDDSTLMLLSTKTPIELKYVDQRAKTLEYSQRKETVTEVWGYVSIPKTAR